MCDETGAIFTTIPTILSTFLLHYTFVLLFCGLGNIFSCDGCGPQLMQDKSEKPQSDIQLYNT